MDAVDDSDLVLQRSAQDLLCELQSCIPKLVSRNCKLTDVRDAVRSDALEHLIAALSTFQELPQLLDPSLPSLLSLLSECLTLALPLVGAPKSVHHSAVSLPAATCKLIYNFCKIRGAKVITRFLKNEARYLEPLVDALEKRLQDEAQHDRLREFHPLLWEEKFTLFLWLSHLILTPFPLSSAGHAIPAGDEAGSGGPAVLAGMPFVSRIWALAVGHLSSSSKERDAAVSLLVRLVLRPDMQQAGLLEGTIEWAREQLQASSNGVDFAAAGSVLYGKIGVLALIAGVFNSADAVVIAPHVIPTYKHLQALKDSEEDHARVIAASAVARKLMIKIFRAATVAALTLSSASHTTNANANLIDEILEDVIGDLLASLADPDTPVRYAASKAISIITTKLQEDMATEIIYAVITSLDVNVIWSEHHTDELETGVDILSRSRDLSLVYPLRWQGLILTLAQLLFRRAPSPKLLPSVVNSLLLALSFEQRSSTGTSIGGPVRDAANFGTWSLARRYTTKELLSIDASSVRAIASNAKNLSILQIVACELVCAACLDPSGNIRRGSSAALQELIGRHPDTIAAGIGIVQVVDYHAVALRSAALLSVTNGASRLDNIYRTTLLAGLLGWRGISAIDADSRRQAAESIGCLAGFAGHKGIIETVQVVWALVQALQLREVERRHGLFLALEYLLKALEKLEASEAGKIDLRKETSTLLSRLWQVFGGTGHVTVKSFTDPSLRPALTAEAVSRLLKQLIRMSQGSAALMPKPSSSLLENSIEYTGHGIGLRDEKAAEHSADAGAILLSSTILGAALLSTVSARWIERAQTTILASSGDQGAIPGWLQLLGKGFLCFDTQKRGQVVELFITALTSTPKIERKVAALQNLKYILKAQEVNSKVIEAIKICLMDYTIDQRGDVGSLVRIAAVAAVKEVPIEWLRSNEADARRLAALVGGLAAEKLDKVRVAAWDAFAGLWEEVFVGGTRESCPQYPLDSSSTRYFTRLLSFTNNDFLIQQLLTGLASSAGGGSESVLQASREALAWHMIEQSNDMVLSLFRGFLSVLEDNITDERVAVPAIETIAYVLGARLLARLKQTEEILDSYRKLFVLVQKAHFKSTSIPRLLGAIAIYVTLGYVKCIRTGVLKKLVSMLAHPFPSIRLAVAEGLYCITSQEALLSKDWSRPPPQLKSDIKAVREGVLAY